MAGLFDERAQLVLRLLQEAGERPLSLSELRVAGIENPAQVVYELELAGHPVERSGAGVRLATSRLLEDPPRGRQATSSRLTTRRRQGGMALARRAGGSRQSSRQRQ